MRPNLEPSARFLIEIETAPNLNDPSVVNADLPVMQIGVEMDLEHNIKFEQALLKFVEFVGNFSKLCPGSAPMAQN